MMTTASPAADFTHGSRPRALLAGHIPLCLYAAALLAPLRYDLYINPARGSALLEIAPFLTLMLLWALCAAVPGKTPKRLSLALILMPVLILLIAGFWSMRFTVLFAGSVTDGILSQRWLLYWVLLPVGLALHRNGVPLRRLAWWTVLPAAAVIALFAFRQHTWDLAQMQNSPATNYLVKSDPFRGARLYFPKYALFSLLYISFAAVLWCRRGRLAAIACFAALCLAYAPVYSRLHLAYSAILLVIYALAFSGRQKTYLVPRLLVTAPFLLCIALALSPSAVAFISNDTASGATRLAMLPVLLTLAADNPLFGTGTGSAQDVSLQTVYGAFFHPSDWGLLGLGVTHGLTGVLITLCILLANLRNAVEAERTAPPPLRFFAAGLVLNALFLLTGYVTFSPLAASDGNAAMVLTLLFSKILQLESCKPENRHGSGPSE